MYCLMMRTAVKPDLKPKTLFTGRRYISFKEIEMTLTESKFYQKLFVVLISLSTILIFPESPIELGNICESYNSKQLCNVW